MKENEFNTFLLADHVPPISKEMVESYKISRRYKKELELKSDFSETNMNKKIMTEEQFNKLVKSSRILKDFKVSTALRKDYTLNDFNEAYMYSILRYLSDLVLESSEDEEKALLYGSIALNFISLYEENTKSKIKYEKCKDNFGDFVTLMGLITKIFSTYKLRPEINKFLKNDLIVEIINQCYLLANLYLVPKKDNIDLADLVFNYVNKIYIDENANEVKKELNSQEFNTKYLKNNIYIEMPQQNIEVCLENYSSLTIYFIKENPNMMAVYEYIQNQKELELKYTVEQNKYVSVFGNYVSSNMKTISFIIKDKSFDFSRFLAFLKEQDL